MKVRRFEISGGGEPSATHKLQAFQTRGFGRTGSETSREKDDGVPMLGQLGIVARPVIRRGLRALGLVDGSNVTLLGLFDRAVAHATAVASGETRVFSPQNTEVCVRVGPVTIELRVKAGSDAVRIAPDVGSVELAPGGAGTYANQSVARNGDSVNANEALTTFFTQVKTVCDGIAPGVVTLPAPVTLGTITGSASRAKA